jgi:hypothetical protein
MQRGGQQGAFDCFRGTLSAQLRLRSRFPFLQAVTHLAPSSLNIEHLNTIRLSMSTLKATIDALEAVSIVFGMVPILGENLKSAAEMASKICGQVQVRQDHFFFFNRG